MRIPDELVKKLLKLTNKISPDELKSLVEQAEHEHKSLQSIILKSNLLTEPQLTQLYSHEIDVPFANIVANDIDPETLQLIPERVARKYRSIAFSIDEDNVVFVAMEDPDDIQAINFIQKQMGRPIRVHIATSHAIQAAIDLYSGENVSDELAKVITDEDKETVDEVVAQEDVAEDSPIAKTLNLIIDYGIKTRASDIHIEPREDGVMVRYRVDGVLHEANKLPRKVLAALISRIKILANLKIDEHRAPQDGRFKISVNDHGYALRVSTLPIVDGEKVVIRILDESSKSITLEQLGYWGEPLLILQHAIKQPHGLILVTGPTGSGKSTSLFSVLSSLNSPTVNISTIEDPVEYKVIGANQTQINPVAGMTFASGLRSLLRQDPNIIMVGEVRDKETADLAVQAALTGHLVFSTLHTNDAATCLPRLIDMDVEPFLIASTVRVVVGQRLVRHLCMDCRVEYIPDSSALQRIMSAFKINAESDVARINQLEKEAIDSGLGVNEQDKNPENSKTMSSTEKTIKRLWKANPEGCSHCGNSGYIGRFGVYEVLPVTEGIQKLIMTSATSEAISKQAVIDGMVTMTMDGLIKALRGETSIEEVMRVISDEV
ncbi:MAG TPA: GspE/PulE family protein [Candidatus Saccharimonadales bacterium]